MEETELKGILKREIEAATGFMSDEVASDRSRLMDRYLGGPLGNEIEGRSKVVSTDVQDVIESIMPDLMQIFTSGTQAVKFEPQGPEDEEAASQANDLINHIFYVQNNGFLVLYDMMKTALIQINGFAKVWVEKSEEWKKHTLGGLTEDEMALIMSEKDIEILEHTERGGEDAGADRPAQPPETGPASPAPTIHDLTIKRLENRTKFKVEALPPEEFLFSRNARTLEDSDILSHRRERRISDLIEEGHDAELLRRIPSSQGLEFNQETISRNFRESSVPVTYDNEDTNREILVHESYLHVDWDDDGVPEYRKITSAGPGYEILDNEEVNDHPFVSLTPIRMPGRVLGIALAELAEDIGLIKTSLWRSTLDNLYFINNGRAVISSKVRLEDVLSNRTASPIRVDTSAPDVAGHIQNLAPNPVGQITMPMLEYCDTVREIRTGVTRYSQGLDSESLNKTATGINQILGRAQQRILLIARLFAETGIKDLFRKLLKLTIDHSEKEHVIRLRNRFVPIDPRSWNAEMDMTINVGLGHGTQEQRAMMMNMLLQIQQKIIQFQGGVRGPLVTMEEIGNALEQWTAAIGLKSPDPYFKRVDANTPLPPPPPNPEVEKMKMEMQLEAGKAQFQGQLEEKKMMLEHMREMQRMGLENARENARLDMEMMESIMDQRNRQDMMKMDAAMKRESAMMKANQPQRRVQ